MTRKKKIAIWAAVLAVLIGIVVALRLVGWNQTYGLSAEVIAGERTPTNVTYNQSVLYAASWETRKSERYRFILAQEKQDGPWIIYSIGHG